jgi:hypothetical protein
MFPEEFKAATLYASLNSSAFPKLNAAARRKFVLFGSTFVREQAFSTMKLNKLELGAAVTDFTMRQHRKFQQRRKHQTSIKWLTHSSQ